MHVKCNQPGVTVKLNNGEDGSYSESQAEKGKLLPSTTCAKRQHRLAGGTTSALTTQSVSSGRIDG